MDVWRTYRLSDFLLFSPHTYYRQFELYNADLWPMQILFFAFGVALVVLVWRRPPWQGRVIAAILAATRRRSPTEVEPIKANIFQQVRSCCMELRIMYEMFLWSYL